MKVSLNSVNNTDNSNPTRFQWEGFPGGRKVIMLNSDIAIVRQLDDSNKHATTGQVSCKFVERSPGNEPACPMARSDLFSDFRDAFQKLTTTGHVVQACDANKMCPLRPRGGGGGGTAS